MEKKIIILISYLLLISCNQRKKNETNNNLLINDSIINISKSIKYDLKIDSTKAISTLNEYFKNKGFLIQKELDFSNFDPELRENIGKKAIDFLDLKKGKVKNLEIGIITYYSCEPFENGHCVEPHYAIIGKTEKKIEILNEDFINHTFVIDSIKNDKLNSIIYGYYYQCQNGIKLKNYRIELN